MLRREINMYKVDIFFNPSSNTDWREKIGFRLNSMFKCSSIFELHLCFKSRSLTDTCCENYRISHVQWLRSAKWSTSLISIESNQYLIRCTVHVYAMSRFPYKYQSNVRWQYTYQARFSLFNWKTNRKSNQPDKLKRKVDTEMYCFHIIRSSLSRFICYILITNLI